jgi:hypothetical protein
MAHTFKNKILVLIPYYGVFPWYFSYFLHSCSFNTSIDFIIFTDIDFDGEIPPNVKFIYKSLDDIKTLASTKLQMPIALDFPYKLCDFRPAYGIIFNEYIKNYSFWGQGDIDVIFGDIRGFLTDELLDSHDFISVRHDYTTGCFALYRNTESINNLFKKSKDYEKVFTNTQHFCFDECNFVHEELTAGSSIFDLKTDIVSFTHLIKDAERKNEIRAYFDFILMEGYAGRLRFDNGRIIYRNTYEVILFHMLWLKRLYKPIRKVRVIPNKYKISPTRIYHLNN